jgi:hypothetical protein
MLIALILFFRPPKFKVSNTFDAALDMLFSDDDELVPSAEGTSSL